MAASGSRTRPSVSNLADIWDALVLRFTRFLIRRFHVDIYR